MRNKDKQRNMPPLPSGHLCCSLAGLQSLHCTSKSVPWVRQQWCCRRLRLVCSGYFAFAFPCFLPSGSGRVFSVGCSPLRALPSVPSLPLLGQLLWAGAWLGWLLMYFLPDIPPALASLLLWCPLWASCLLGSPFCSISPALLGQLLFSSVTLFPMVVLAEVPSALWWVLFGVGGWVSLPIAKPAGTCCEAQGSPRPGSTQVAGSCRQYWPAVFPGAVCERWSV